MLEGLNQIKPRHSIAPAGSQAGDSKWELCSAMECPSRGRAAGFLRLGWLRRAGGAQKDRLAFLDTRIWGLVWAERPLADDPVDLRENGHESPLDVGCLEGRCLDERQPFLLGIALGSFCGNSPQVLQVGLVPDQHDDNVGVGMVPQFLEPPFHILQGRRLRNIVHQEGSEGSPVVGAGDRPIPFLACRVPYLSFHTSPLDLTKSTGKE